MSIVLFLANIGYYVLPVLAALLILRSSRPKSKVVKSMGAVLVPWILLPFYVVLVLNPVGSAYAVANGQEDPGMRYDNNTVAVALLGGWVIPLVVCVSFSSGYANGRRSTDEEERETM